MEIDIEGVLEIVSAQAREVAILNGRNKALQQQLAALMKELNELKASLQAAKAADQT